MPINTQRHLFVLIITTVLYSIVYRAQFTLFQRGNGRPEVWLCHVTWRHAIVPISGPQARNAPTRAVSK